MRRNRDLLLFVVFIFIAHLPRLAATAEVAYDPLDILDARLPEPFDIIVKDQGRSRELPLRIYLLASQSPAAVILFSHGLGGSRDDSAFLGRHWAARGYVAVFLQHPGSDESVWKDTPILKRRTAMRQAAGLENFLLRVKDVSAVLDQCQRSNDTGGHVLARKMDVDTVGMSGHSFGAVTTQAVSGQSFVRGGASFTDRRIKAAITFSPSGPRDSRDPNEAFGQVKIPWMLMTGTKDISSIGGVDVESRLSVFPALPPGGKYELVLDKAEHSAFTDRPLPGDREKRNPNHHRAILALSTAFWDAWLRHDAQAKSWLDGDGPRTMLEPDDRWQKK